MKNSKSHENWSHRSYLSTSITFCTGHSQTWDLDYSIRRALILEKKMLRSNLNIGISQNLEKTDPDVPQRSFIFEISTSSPLTPNYSQSRRSSTSHISYFWDTAYDARKPPWRVKISGVKIKPQDRSFIRNSPLTHKEDQSLKISRYDL